MDLTIVGATGLVGKKFISLLKNSDYKFKNIYLVHSKETNEKYYSLNDIIDKINHKNSIVINCANKEVAKRLKLLESIVIDNSNAFRMNKEVPLVIPHINFKKSNYIANPNCSSIILSTLLHPLMKYNIKRLVISTYQAASGAGYKGLEELKQQQYEYVNDLDITKDYWGVQYINNCFVHNSKIEENFYNEEENKMINEVNKIFNSNIKITATCIRVPVFQSHCISVNIEFNDEIEYNDIIKLINEDENLEYNDKTDTLISTDNIKVFVGHIRPDYTLDKNKGWNFWLSGDQLLRGAAYNAFKIMEKFL